MSIIMVIIQHIVYFTDEIRLEHCFSDRLLVDGQYEPIHIDELAEDTLQGYSGVLNLNIRWEGGQLRWYDPTTDQHIVTFDDERARADRAEAQVQELEAELQRLREA